VPWLALDILKVGSFPSIMYSSELTLWALAQQIPLGGKQKEFVDFSAECFMKRRSSGSTIRDVFSWLLVLSSQFNYGSPLSKSRFGTGRKPRPSDKPFRP
jgi:hypothetical protein